MRIVDFLRLERILPEMKARTKAEALLELAQGLAPELGGTPVPELVRILEARERLGSTGIEDGLAIPHGKLGAIRAVHACFGRSRSGIEFGARDGKPTTMFFLLLAPEDSSMLHLKALARIARLLKSPGFRAAIDAAGSAEEIFAAIARGDELV